MSTKCKAKVESVNEFTCCGVTMPHKEFMAHITREHGYVKGTQCTRSLTLAVDGSDSYHNVFEWQIPCGPKGETIVKAQQVNSGPRNTHQYEDEDEG